MKWLVVLTLVLVVAAPAEASRRNRRRNRCVTELTGDKPSVDAKGEEKPVILLPPGVTLPPKTAEAPVVPAPAPAVPVVVPTTNPKPVVTEAPVAPRPAVPSAGEQLVAATLRPDRVGELAMELGLAEALIDSMKAPGRKVVSLLVGDDIWPNQLRDLVKAYLSRGYVILYDADTDTGEWIGGEAGDRGIGITSRGKGTRRREEGRLVSLGSAYLRLKVFSSAHEVTAVSGSPTGAAMIPFYKLDHLLDPDYRWTFSLKDWRDRNERKYGLGVDFTKYPYAVRSVHELENRLRGGGDGRAFTLDLNGYLTRSSDFTLANVLETARNMAAGEKALEGDAKRIPGGGVIFGASKLHPDFAEGIYELGRLFALSGVPTATGGAGGSMLVANAGAFDAGGVSQGIPISRVNLAREKQTMSDVHTQTVSAMGYEVRIPLLLHRRQLVVFAPGGDGTLRELAATLIQQQALRKYGEPFEMVFLSSEYYGGFVDALKRLLPASMARHIHLVDRPDQLKPLVEKLRDRLADKPVARNDYRSWRDRQPRPREEPIPMPELPAFADKEISPLRKLSSMDLKIGETYPVSSTLRVKILKKLESGWDRFVYHVTDETGRHLVLKLPSQKAAVPLEKIHSDATRAHEITGLGIANARIVYFDGFALVREWTEGVRGDDWLKDWQRGGLKEDDAGIQAMAHFLAQSAQLGAYVGKVDPEDAILANGEWVVVDSGGVTRNLSAEQVLQRHFEKLGSRWGDKLWDKQRFLKVLKKLLEKDYGLGEVLKKLERSAAPAPGQSSRRVETPPIRKPDEERSRRSWWSSWWD